MSLIYTNPNLTNTDPQTHALVIGVGDYPHLRNGSAFKTQPAKFNMGLGQLTSSTISAEEFAKWLIQNYNNPQANIGTVELLLSPTTNFNSISIESATMQNIQEAFDRWEARCNQSQNNVAIFYFCGHGAEYETMVLFPEDFGASPNRPWDTSIDFNNTWYGMGECKAQTQLYFLDACRESPLDVLKSRGFSPRSLKTTQLTRLIPRAAPILKAAAPGRAAHGNSDQISYFTEELLKCFNGIGADRKVRGVWKVTPESITKAMVLAMNRRQLPCGSSGEINIPGSTIHTIQDPASSVVRISCSPLPALSLAELQMRQNTQIVYSRNPSQNPWEHEVKTGLYDIEAIFPHGQYNNKIESNQFVMPPYHECELEVL